MTIATVEWVFVNFIFFLFYILNTKYCWVFKVWVVLNFRMTLKVYLYMHESTETATRGVLCKKLFLEISQNSHENTCARVFFLCQSNLAWKVKICLYNLPLPLTFISNAPFPSFSITVPQKNGVKTEFVGPENENWTGIFQHFFQNFS